MLERANHLQRGTRRRLGLPLFFCLLASYLILRPVRDEMGITAGRDTLHYLFTATFFVMLSLSPFYAGAIARLARRRFIPLIYWFFIVNLVIFWLLLFFWHRHDLYDVLVFVGVSVFNLFAVSVFWSFMADLWQTEQGKRLFGLIAAGGNAGSPGTPAGPPNVEGLRRSRHFPLTGMG